MAWDAGFERRGSGAKVRYTDRPLDRMLAYDRKVAVVAAAPSESARGALVIRQPEMPRLDAANRFHAAMPVKERGWI